MARGRALHRRHCHSCERSSLQTSWDVDNQPAETASSKYFYAALRRLNFLTCVLCLRVVFSLGGPDERAHEWRRKRKRKSFARLTTTCRAPLCRLDPPILRIAEATGQKIACERAKPPAGTAFKLNCSILGVAPVVQIRMSSLTIACCRERLDPCRLEEQGAMNYRK